MAVSLITEEMVQKAWDEWRKADGRTQDRMRCTINAILPDIVEVCAKVAEEVETAGSDIAADRIRYLILRRTE